MYALSDLKIVDSKKWVKEHPTPYFFNTASPDAFHLLNYLMLDVLNLGKGMCNIFETEDGWWCIASDRNWFEHPQYALQELFSRLVAEPRHGDNCNRAEVVISAFATHITVWLGGETILIQGESVPSATIARVASYSCALVFKM